MTIIKKSTNNKCCWWECKLLQSQWKTIWRFLRKLKIELPFGPVIPLLCIYLEKKKTLIWKDTCTPMFIPVLFTIAKIRKQPKCPSTNWFKKMWCVCVCTYMLPKWWSSEEPTCQCRKCQWCRFNPWVGKIPWSRKWQSALVFLSGKFYGQRSLAGYYPWGHKQSNTTEHTRTHIYIDTHLYNIAILLSHKTNNETLLFAATWRDLGNIILICDIIYVESKK